MKVRSVVLFCSLLLALALIPTRVFADAWCSDPPPYQYQSCGVVAPANSFTANVAGYGVNMLFYGYHADFSSSINALVWRGNQLVYTGPTSPLNTDMHQYQFFNLVPADELQTGDQIELVLHVNDPNGNQDFYSSEISKNSDGLNHLWAETLTDGQCIIIVAQCTFVGFEDLPQQEGSDFDYNDFKAIIFGMHINNGSNESQVPEPSSIALLTAAPLAFVLNRFRRFL